MAKHKIFNQHLQNREAAVIFTATPLLHSGISFGVLTLIVALLSGCSHNTSTSETEHTWEIPGRLECEWYIGGGEGKAYHDSDSTNNGSGKLNPVNGNPLHEFRVHEGVDISYTKTGGIDDTPYNLVPTQPNQLYVGWTVPQEWIKYNINVLKSGAYDVGVMYTAMGTGTIAFDVDGIRAADSLSILSTVDNRDSVAWRQWHHWNFSPNIGTINLKEGRHMLTLHVVENGNMNFDYFVFRERR